ncbi:hypothetical protein [Streptomyces umbrinus]|uniref:hypothetical protein n=1 Tax=Streptomyces umbrinus TaxID=67370 RepID=UPI003C2D10D3
MSHAFVITTPARNAMEGHGLTDARTILASDPDLHPKLQGQSMTRRAVAYSVYCPATERYSLVTLDGRWIIPGREGYKTRGPVATYARKNIATVRPDGLVILEPVRHNGPFKATRYGRRPGTCRQAIGDDWRGIYGYACSCGAGVQPEKVSRDGWVIVRDGRGTHTVSYALRIEHRREFGTVPMEVPERANVVVAGAPEAPAVKAPATVDAPAESAPVAEVPAVKASAVKAPAVHTPVKAPAQTPETAPEGTPESARRLISTSETGRAYVTGNGQRLRIESADGRMAYTLHTVHDEAHEEPKNGFAALAREFAGEVAKRGKGAPKWRKRPLGMWTGKPQRSKEFAPADYAPGAMLAWTVDGVSYTGQVWANRIRSGKWNGDRGETSAVVVATIDGRRARRDEAVCLPFVHGSRRTNAYAFVCTDGGNADASVIAAECAGDGLFDMVTPSVDPVDAWEGEGGAVAGAETPEPADAPADDVEPSDAPAAAAAPEIPAGAHCHRCGTDTVFGAECRTCGRVDIVAAMMSSGPVLCPAEEKAMATGRQYCPRCFAVGVPLYATMLNTGPGYACAECYTAYGRRLPEAGPAPVKAPAGAVVRATRAARKEAEEAGASVGEVHRAREAARKAVAVAYGQRPADVISDPCSVDAWEDEGGACVGVDQPGEPDAGRGAAPLGTDPSPEMGTCTAPAVDVTPARPDVVSDPGDVDTWDDEGGAVPGVEVPRVRLVGEQRGSDPYAVRPAVAEWLPTPGTNRRTTELTCAGVQYRVYQAPDAVLPYTVRRTLGGADVDLGGWVGMDDVRAIVRADRRRMAALEADRRRVEQQQRRAAYRMRGEMRQTPVRLTEEDRRDITRRAEEKHRPVAAELYVSPITGNAVLNSCAGRAPPRTMTRCGDRRPSAGATAPRYPSNGTPLLPWWKSTAGPSPAPGRPMGRVGTPCAPRSHRHRPTSHGWRRPTGRARRRPRRGRGSASPPSSGVGGTWSARKDTATN